MVRKTRNRLLRSESSVFFRQSAWARQRQSFVIVNRPWRSWPSCLLSCLVMLVCHSFPTSTQNERPTIIARYCFRAWTRKQQLSTNRPLLTPEIKCNQGRPCDFARLAALRVVFFCQPFWRVDCIADGFAVENDALLFHGSVITIHQCFPKL